jgi:hypothetical protein
VIPVEVTQTPWHFTTLPDALDHWQTIIAGLIALKPLRAIADAVRAA